MAELAYRAEWRNPAQGRADCTTSFLPWVGQQLSAGRALIIEARLWEDAKTDRQRAYYHGIVLKTIAQQARGADGAQFPLAVWKEYFRAEYLGHKTVTTKNPITGKKVRRRQRVSTEDLGIRAYSKLIDRVQAFAATDLNVTFPASFDQWEAAISRGEVDPETGEILG